MDDRYEQFEEMMAKKFPRYCGDDACFGGYAVGEGWYDIIESLVGQIDHYTRWKRSVRVYDLRVTRAMRKGRDALIQLLAKGRTPGEWESERADIILSRGTWAVTPKVNWIRISQIKEKFGGLRFYYDGGDDTISGMVSMAEAWASRTCEKCGNVAQRRTGGWVRTLCDEHEAEYQAKKTKMQGED